MDINTDYSRKHTKNSQNNYACNIHKNNGTNKSPQKNPFLDKKNPTEVSIKPISF